MRDDFAYPIEGDFRISPVVFQIDTAGRLEPESRRAAQALATASKKTRRAVLQAAHREYLMEIAAHIFSSAMASSSGTAIRRAAAGRWRILTIPRRTGDQAVDHRLVLPEQRAAGSQPEKRPG